MSSVGCIPWGGWSLRGLGEPHSSARSEGSCNKGSQEGQGWAQAQLPADREGQEQRAPCPVPRTKTEARCPRSDRLRVQQPPNNRSHMKETSPRVLLPFPQGPRPSVPNTNTGHQGLGSAEYPEGSWESSDVGGRRVAHPGGLFHSTAEDHRILGISLGECVPHFRWLMVCPVILLGLLQGARATNRLRQPLFVQALGCPAGLPHLDLFLQVFSSSHEVLNLSVKQFPPPAWGLRCQQHQ